MAGIEELPREMQQGILEIMPPDALIGLRLTSHTMTDLVDTFVRGLNLTDIRGIDVDPRMTPADMLNGMQAGELGTRGSPATVYNPTDAEIIDTLRNQFTSFGGTPEWQGSQIANIYDVLVNNPDVRYKYELFAESALRDGKVIDYMTGNTVPTNTTVQGVLAGVRNGTMIFR